MENNEIKGKINKLKFLWAVFWADLLIFWFIFSKFVTKDSNIEPDKLLNLTYLSYFSAGILIALAYMIYKNIVKKSSKTSDFQEYYKAVLIKLLLFELAGIVSLYVYFMSDKVEILYVLGIIIIIFLINMPSESDFYRDFGKPKEKNRLGGETEEEKN